MWFLVRVRFRSMYSLVWFRIRFGVDLVGEGIEGFKLGFLV